MRRKKRKLENKLTKIVDGTGRETAENLINEEVRRLIEDVVEILVRAVRRNPENPMAELSLDVSSSKKTRELLQEVYKNFNAISEGQKAAKRTAVRRVKNSVNRLDVCYLANLTGLVDGYSSRLSKLLNSIRDGVRAPWDVDGGSATGSTKNRKFVPAISKAKRNDHIREFAKNLKGKPLQTKCLNVVEERLLTMPDDKDSMRNFKEFVGENAVRLTNAVQTTLRGSIDVALDTIKNRPNITARELHNVVRNYISPAFGSARNAAKVASRGVVSSVLNMSIVDEVERLVSFGIIGNEDFFLNRPGFLYKAVMDLRTSDICRTLNGLVIPLSDKARLYRYMPPQHANCRSILIPNLRV